MLTLDEKGGARLDKETREIVVKLHEKYLRQLRAAPNFEEVLRTQGALHAIDEIWLGSAEIPPPKK